MQENDSTNLSKKYDMTVFIGRFRPFHNSHLYIVEEALRRSRYLTILVGSCHAARSIRNPFTFHEVSDMIRNSLSSEDESRVIIADLEDNPYNDTLWARDVQNKVALACRITFTNSPDTNIKPSIALIGHAKDFTSYYLNMFPQWDSIDVDSKQELAATDIRNLFFDPEQWAESLEEPLKFEKIIPMYVFVFLKRFSKTKDYVQLCNEFKAVQNYREKYLGLPYPPIFTTVDAVVIQSSHVLLVKRKAFPGKGLWALPGGYVNVNEKIDDAWLRELKEETSIKIHDKILRNSVVAKEIFDDPHRDPRGRVITHAFLVWLEPGKLARIKGGDDAALARWVPLGELSRANLYSDHYSIVNTLVSHLSEK